MDPITGGLSQLQLINQRSDIHAFTNHEEEAYSFLTLLKVRSGQEMSFLDILQEAVWKERFSLAIYGKGKEVQRLADYIIHRHGNKLWCNEEMVDIVGLPWDVLKLKALELSDWNPQIQDEILTSSQL